MLQKEILILNFPYDVSSNNICVWFRSAKLVPHSIKLKLCLVDFRRKRTCCSKAVLCCCIGLKKLLKREESMYFFLKIVTLCVKSDLRFHFHLHSPLAHINLFYCWLFLVRLFRLYSPEKNFSMKAQKSGIFLLHSARIISLNITFNSRATLSEWTIFIFFFFKTFLHSRKFFFFVKIINVSI